MLLSIFEPEDKMSLSDSLQIYLYMTLIDVTFFSFQTLWKTLTRLQRTRPTNYVESLHAWTQPCFLAMDPSLR